MMKKVHAKAEEVCNLLCTWHDQGRSLPSYKRKRGKVFLLRLFCDVEFSQTECDINNYNNYWEKRFAPHEAELDALLGPHGWSILQILLIRYRDRLNDKWRKINEEKTSTGLQNV